MHIHTHSHTHIHTHTHTHAYTHTHTHTHMHTHTHTIVRTVTYASADIYTRTQERQARADWGLLTSSPQPSPAKREIRASLTSAPFTRSDTEYMLQGTVPLLSERQSSPAVLLQHLFRPPARPSPIPPQPRAVSLPGTHASHTERPKRVSADLFRHQSPSPTGARVRIDEDSGEGPPRDFAYHPESVGTAMCEYSVSWMFF
jgi:hypothetical protein